MTKQPAGEGGLTVHPNGDIAGTDRAKNGLAKTPLFYGSKVYQHIE
ncbi:MAG: hypothetical protein ABJQ14_00755 [Hyphomicrobiales bacterium]